jgi:hypothetical protein
MKKATVKKRDAKPKLKRGLKKKKKNLVQINVTDPLRFKYIKDFLCARGDYFEYTSCGSINTIIHNGKEYIGVDVKEMAGKGYHLSQVLQRDIDLWVASNRATLTPNNTEHLEQMFNLSAIEKSVGKIGVAIDLDDCYWNTTHRLGYIRYKTFIAGLRKKQWKTGRNAAIGALAKRKYVVPFFMGKPQFQNRKEPIDSPDEYRWIRNDIIGSIYNLFYGLYELIGDEFYMFLTDCVFTSYEARPIVEKYFADHGYKFKSKPIEFLRVDRMKRKISWHDFTGTKKDSKDNVLQTGVDRYYMFSMKQVVDGTTKNAVDKTNTLQANFDFIHSQNQQIRPI